MMRRFVLLSAVGIASSVLALGACSSGGSPGGGPTGGGVAGAGGGGASGGGQPPGSGPAGKTGSSLALRVGATGQPKGVSHAYTMGQSTTDSLQSLKYYVTSVTICEELDTGGGSGFQNPKNCLDIYSAARGAYAYDPMGDYSGLAVTARASDVGFVDLMNPASRATLGASVVLADKDAHAYNWGIITWVPVVKVTASVPMSDGSTWYTHDGTSERIVQNMAPSYVTTSSASLASGPASEAVVLSANGGTWFRFQHPFTIAQADITNAESFVLDLTLDPDALVSGGPVPGSGTLREGGDGGLGDARQLHIPSLDLTPVPHKASSHAVRETYVADVGGAFRLRLELYTLEDDPDRTIYGVDTRALYTGGTAWVSEFAKVSYLDEKDGALTFRNWDRSPEIDGFQRGAKEGDTTSATIHCIASGAGGGASAAVIFDGCPMGGTLPVTFHLTAVQRVDDTAVAPSGTGIEAGTDAQSGDGGE